MRNEVIESLDDPERLETLYRTQKPEFLKWLQAAREMHPDSIVLKVWNSRVTYSKAAAVDVKASRVTPLNVFLISTIAGALVKLHALPSINGDWYLPRFAPLALVGALISYFLISNPLGATKLPILGISVCIAILFLLPDAQGSDSIVMSLIHMPLVLLSLLAITFMGNKYKETQERILFIRYVGEVLIYSSIILLGGIVLTFLTIGLFALIDIEIEEWYIEYVVVFGLVAAPIVATYLYDIVLGRGSRVATVIANVFAPLFLITVSVYLVTIIAQGMNPYSDREFLITVNGLLLLVLAMTIYSVSGNGTTRSNTTTDVINISLVSVTLIINVYALTAIVLRWAEYGTTPNRVSVTGANIIIFSHLILILREYTAQIRQHRTYGDLLATVAKYLPIYTVWSVLMVLVLPLLFSFE